MVPIGRGQREPIIGDRKTGKTNIVLDTIINQRGKDVICVYVAIGQKDSTIDVGVSVSRVDADAQIQAMKKAAVRLRLDLAAYYELLDFARLGTELDQAAQRRLDRGKRMVELLKQPQFSPSSVGEEVVTILAGSSGLLDEIPIEAVSRFATDMRRWLDERYPDLVAAINKTGKLGDELATKLTDRINEYKAVYRETRKTVESR